MKKIIQTKNKKKYRKDCLWKNLLNQKRKFPKEYNFVPNTYLLGNSNDWERFTKLKEDSNSSHLWIMKPVNQACGRGIKMISKKTKIHKKKNYLVCEYIAHPHLINDLKYDLRLYVLVTSYDPLRIYLYNEGLTRFATEKYSVSLQELGKRYVHLTNYSVNKNNKKNYVPNTDNGNGCEGSKWPISILKEKYREIGVDSENLFKKIKDIIIKALISSEPLMLNSSTKSQEHRNNCFEFYGFDILIDNKLQPWLLEVNVCPSLSSSSPLDRRIKHRLISDILNIVGIAPYSKKLFIEDLKNKLPGVNEKPTYQSKNIHDLQDLDYDNCLTKLSPEDWVVLFETDEEFYRRGNFERIYPVSDEQQMSYYIKLFEF